MQLGLTLGLLVLNDLLEQVWSVLYLLAELAEAPYEGLPAFDLCECFEILLREEGQELVDVVLVLSQHIFEAIESLIGYISDLEGQEVTERVGYLLSDLW